MSSSDADNDDTWEVLYDTGGGLADNGLSAVRPDMAVISDIHSNLPALEAVLAHIRDQGINMVVCLGDVIGYGPNPGECWKLVSELCPIIIRGNHDQALAMQHMERFHPRARGAIEWTRRRFLEDPDGEAIISAISSLPRSTLDGEFFYVHGSPAGPTMDYLLPGDSYDKTRMAREFAQFGGTAFNGHSHIPGVIVRGSRFMPPEALRDMRIKLGGEKAIVNVGSVGQPRDGNPKACYVTIREGVLQYHRIAYDAEETCKRILAIPDLDRFLGERLLSGH